MDSLLFYYSTKKQATSKEIACQFICPLKMELNEEITRLAHFGKPQFTQRK